MYQVNSLVHCLYAELWTWSFPQPSALCSLLKLYADIDVRCIQLAVLFRLWARVCMCMYKYVYKILCGRGLNNPVVHSNYWTWPYCSCIQRPYYCIRKFCSMCRYVVLIARRMATTRDTCLCWWSFIFCSKSTFFLSFMGWAQLVFCSI